MVDLTGKTLGKYRLVERLGRGGMAEVYKAYQPGLDRYVAIKLMHGYLADDEDFVGRFQREAKAIAALHHPHIVQVHDFDIEDDVYYMVQEYIEGGTLKAKLKAANESGQTIPFAETVQILVSICDAVDYAHQQGRIHRDIKPDNIMFDARNRPVLTDFGIASIVGGTRFTATGAMVGTPAYMSPEQGTGESGDERSDVYSLGVVLYEMVTGRIPFDADTPFAVVLKHVNEPLPMPRSLNADVPYSVERVILKALAKDPADRYQSAGELAGALEEAFQDETAPLWDAPLLPAEMPAAATPPLAEPVETKPPPPDAPTRRRKPWRWIIAGAVALILLFCCLALALSVHNKIRRRASAKLTPSPAVQSTQDTPPTATVEPTPATDSAAQPFIQAGFEKLAQECNGDLDSAMALFEQAIEQDPNAAEAYVGRAYCHVCNGNINQSMKDLDKAIELDPNNARAFFMRGRLWGHQEKGEKAIADLTRAIELKPDYVEAYYWRGEVYRSPLEDYEQAFEDYNRAIELSPNYAPPYLSRGGYYLWHKSDANAAIADLDRYVNLKPDDPTGYDQRASVYIELLQDYEKGVQEYTLALEHAPDDEKAAYYESRGWAYHQWGRPIDAIDDYTRKIDQEPEPKTLFYRGMAHYETQNYQAAMADFDKVLLLGDEYIGAAYHAKGWVYQMREEFAEAIEAYNKAAGYDFDSYAPPFFENTHLLLDRAIAYRSNQQLTESLTDLNKLIEQYDDWSLAYYHRALTYKALGQPRKALQDLRQAWEYAPDSDWRAIIEEQMQLLKPSSSE